MRALVIGAALAFAAGSAVAAPFCVVTSYGDQCYYYDYPSCQRAAERARSTCVAQGNEQNNSDAQPPRSNYAPPQRASGPPFCVVTSYGNQCYYYDAPSCQRAAQSARGACVVNPDR